MATVLKEDEREINFNILLSIRNNLKELVYNECNVDFLSFIKSLLLFLSPTLRWVDTLKY
jgi:hypothetical protein